MRLREPMDWGPMPSLHTPQAHRERTQMAQPARKAWHRHEDHRPQTPEQIDSGEFGVVLVIGIVLSKFGKLDRRVLVRCSADQSGSRQSIILHGIFWCGGGVTGAVSRLLIRP
jgi:hypothetical protein